MKSLIGTTTLDGEVVGVVESDRDFLLEIECQNGTTITRPASGYA